MQLSVGTSEKALLSTGVLKTFPGFSGGLVQCLHAPHGSSHVAAPLWVQKCPAWEAAAPCSDTGSLLHTHIPALNNSFNSLLLLFTRKPRCKWFLQGSAFLSPSRIWHSSRAVIKQWGNCGNVVARGQPCPGSCSGSRPDGSWHLVFPQLNRTLKHNSWNYCTSQLSNVQLIDCLSL